MSEEVSKNLKRYYLNQEKYNERAKLYFRSVWYVKNRNKVLLKQKEYRLARTPKVKEIIYPISQSLIVSFD